MELLVAIFFFWMLSRFVERRENARMFAPTQCRYCDMLVIHMEDGWVHQNGEVWMPFPDLKGNPAAGIPPSRHPALPTYLGALA